MKRSFLPVAFTVVLAISINGCGKTQRTTSTDASVSSSVAVPPPSPPPAPPPSPPPSPPPITGSAPLTYSFTKLGTENFVTPAITTDNVLKIKFTVSPDQGNSVWKASELKVFVHVAGTSVTPTYTSSNYVYGNVGETSNVIDLSSYLQPGQSPSITIDTPANDFYCTYAPNPFYYWSESTYSWQPTNPQYNQYPGCRKAVFRNHNWGGTLTIQTSTTQAI